MREAYFHEDDYCQVEALPISNWDRCASELENIDEFSQAHSAGIGWTSIYVRDENAQRILSLNISIAALASALSPILPPYDKVLTGYSSHREESKRTLAFGTETACIVFAGYDENGVIEDIWFEMGLTDQAGKDRALSGLSALARLGKLLLVDWSASRLIELANPEQIKSYFEDLVQNRANALRALRNWIDSQGKQT